jgi:uncharacterized coiled-coil protein SlyX
MELHAMKPNFQAMTIQELKAYLVEHRNDTEAFHTLMDKIKTGDNLNFYEMADVSRFPELLAQARNVD